AFYLGGALPVADRTVLTMLGNQANGRFGAGVDVLPDFDHDLDQELVVRHPEVNAGAVYLRRGGDETGTFPIRPNDVVDGGWDVRFVGTRKGMRLGSALAYGDMNGDGELDLVLGASSARFPDFDQGGAYV